MVGLMLREVLRSILSIKRIEKKKNKGWECNSEAESLPRIFEAQNSIPSTAKEKKRWYHARLEILP